jgi:hypothetical protein
VLDGEIIRNRGVIRYAELAFSQVLVLRLRTFRHRRWCGSSPSPDVAVQLEVPHHILDLVDEGRLWVKHIPVRGRSQVVERRRRVIEEMCGFAEA